LTTLKLRTKTKLSFHSGDKIVVFDDASKRITVYGRKRPRIRRNRLRVLRLAQRLFNSQIKAVIRGYERSRNPNLDQILARSEDIHDAMERELVRILRIAGQTAINSIERRQKEHIEYEPTHPEVTRWIATASDRFLELNENSRKVILRVVERGFNEGIGPAELSSRLRQVGVDWDTRRAQVLMRTEVQKAANRGAVDAAFRMGTRFVEVQDGSGKKPDKPCVDANGEIWNLRRAFNNLVEHPNCTRIFLPTENR